MGVKLELSDEECYEGMYYNYMVRIPVKNKCGELEYVVTGIPISMDVHVGYIPYNGANVLRQAFKTLGNVYGWGGTLNSRDCSALVMDIHRCFGLILPRDVSGQMQINSCRTIKFDDRACECNQTRGTTGSRETEQNCRKYHKLCDLSAGDILGFPGHTMMYAGFDYNNCTHYVISEMGSFYTFSEGDAKKVTVNSCVLSDLSLMRENGLTWEQSLTYAKILGN
ncbi:MAG: C40 family peptidase [Lachnospiraceae bacterium]|nr:C40 family peptidase [Lachnospiraceae bacterium]